MNKQVATMLCMVLGASNALAMDSQERNRLVLLSAITTTATYVAIHCLTSWLYPRPSVDDLIDAKLNRFSKVFASDRSALQSLIHRVDSEHIAHYTALVSNESQLVQLLNWQQKTIAQLTQELERVKEKMEQFEQDDLLLDHNRQKPAQTHNPLGVRF